MKRQLTDRVVRGLKPAASRYDCWDSGFRDGLFGVRVSPSGKKAWTVVVREADGKKRRVGLGDYDENNGLAKARKAARKVLVKADDGEPVAGDRGPTFADLAAAFLDRYPKQAGLRPSTVAEYTGTVERWLVPAWGRRAAAAVSRADVNALFDEIAYGGTRSRPYMANRALSLASTMFDYAIDTGAYQVDVNPCYRKRRLRETPRDRVLSDDELRALWRILDERPVEQACFFRLAVLTGARSGELKAASWSEFDLDENVWTIPAGRVKTGRTHRLPLSAGAREVLECLTAETGTRERLFPTLATAYGTYVPKLAALLRAALGFEFRVHDLRRTLATGMSRLGVDDAAIGRVLNHGWTQRTVTARVYNVDDRLPEKLKALERWSAHVHRLVTAEPAKVVRIGR